MQQLYTVAYNENIWTNRNKDISWWDVTGKFRLEKQMT